jgi:hypothetical protein
VTDPDKTKDENETERKSATSATHQAESRLAVGVQAKVVSESVEK